MELELRRAARMAMRGVPERLGLEFARGNIEMRAKPNGTAAGSVFTWEGYATVFDAPFQMWDQDGESFTELVAPGAATRTLNNPALDVPFLVGHNSAGIPMARTKSGTLQLSQDSHGVLTYVPSMDGRREDVRALASAVERGDIDEMSLAFVCTRQAWTPDYEQRTILEMDLHRGDVCAVTHGANPATAGSRMYPAEQLAYRRPAAIGGPRLLEARMPTQPYSAHAGESNECVQCHSVNDDAALFCDQCGQAMKPVGPSNMQGVEDMTQRCPCGQWNSADAKYCGQCGTELAGDGGRGLDRMLWSAGKPYELLSVSQAERDKAKADGNSLDDGSYPINNVKQLKAAATLAASHHGDWQAAQKLIRRRAKELGVDLSTLDGFGDEKKSDGRPLEERASAAEDVDIANAPDYNPEPPEGASMRRCRTCNGAKTVPHPVTGKPGKQCPGCNGTGAVVTVDDSTGIPGDEQQLSAARRLELRMRELELEELARN